MLNILPRINALERAVNLEQVYRFTAKSVPESIFLATETPEIFEISVNGQRIDKTDCGYFRDSAFRMLDIAPYVTTGENEIRFKSVIEQSPACYNHISNSWTFESMKNCLSYDMEIEPIYIVGDFGLGFDCEPEVLDNGAYRISKQPVIVEAPTVVDASKLDYCGFAEFAGSVISDPACFFFDISCLPDGFFAVNEKFRNFIKKFFAVNSNFNRERSVAEFISTIPESNISAVDFEIFPECGDFIFIAVTVADP